MTPLPPDPFPDINCWPLEAGSDIERIHDQGFAPTAFNPGGGSPTRFAPLIRADGSVVPHAYAAASYECAAFETVYHDVQHDGPDKRVPLARIEPLDRSRLRVTRPLMLARLHEPDLNRLGLTRGQLIDTQASAYSHTVRWALAIHDAHPRVDGLVWTSRRCDPALAFLLFGTRVLAGDLVELDRTRIVNTHAEFAALRAFGARAGITITL